MQKQLPKPTKAEDLKALLDVLDNEETPVFAPASYKPSYVIEETEDVEEDADIETDSLGDELEQFLKNIKV